MCPKNVLGARRGLLGVRRCSVAATCGRFYQHFSQSGRAGSEHFLIFGNVATSVTRMESGATHDGLVVSDTGQAGEIR